MTFEIECLDAEWEDYKWMVQFLDDTTRTQFTRTASVLISAVGGIPYPRDINFQGMELFKGQTFHSATWVYKVDYTKKRMAVGSLFY